MAAQSAWDRYIKEGRDRTQTTRRQVESFVNQMVKDGQLRATEAQKAVDEIQNRLQKQVGETQKRIREGIRDELKRLGLATRADLDRIERKIARLEKQMSATGVSKKTAAKKTSTVKSAPAKTATAKKSAAKTPAAKAAKKAVKRA